MIGNCRFCGARARIRLSDGIGVCDACANSPLCDRCGHPRSDHSRVFVAGSAAGCRRITGDFQSLTTSPCDCEGFLPVVGQLSDASFAAPDPDPLVLGLRLAGDGSSDTTM